MSAKLFTKLGVQDIDEVIHSVNNAGNKERGGFMMDHITSCNKVIKDVNNQYLKARNAILL